MREAHESPKERGDKEAQNKAEIRKNNRILGKQQKRNAFLQVQTQHTGVATLITT